MKTLKYLLSVVLVLLALSCVSVSRAAEEVASGTCGENVTWVLTDDGTLTISGEGEMSDSPSFIDNSNRITTVVIEDGVTSICENAFRSCENLTSVKISDSVTSIGENIFLETYNLTSIEVSDGNPNYCSIDGVLFNKNATELICYPSGKPAAAYEIPDGVTIIGNSAFRKSTLTNIKIPDGATTIGDSAFTGCKSLTSIEIPKGVTRIGNSAFSSCSSLTSVTIPDSVTFIGEGAFSSCSSLTSVMIPDSVTIIGGGERVFDHCERLTEILVDENNDKFSSVDGVLFNKNRTALYCYPAGKEETSYIIPDSVTHISSYVFTGCNSLASVTIPDSVTFIAAHAFSYCSSLTSVTIPDSVTHIGEGAFSRCNSLTSVTIPRSVTSIEMFVFSPCNSLTSVTILDGATTISYGMFSGCSSLTSVIIPDSVTTIGAMAFYSCSSLTSVKIPDGITSIGWNTFSGCSSLTSVIIPDSVTTIGDKAFGYCEALTTVYYGGTEEQWSAIEINADFFGGNTSLLNAEIIFEYNGVIASGICGENLTWTMSADGILTISGEGEMVEFPSWHDYRDRIVRVIIENGATSISKSAFYECKNLTSVEIPNSVTSIGDNAFSDCNALKNITYVGGEDQWNKIEIGEGNETLEESELVIPAFFPGDVNGDGAVNGTDTNLIFRAVSGATKLTDEQLKAADVNGDGQVNGTDTNLVFRFVSGAIESLG